VRALFASRTLCRAVGFRVRRDAVDGVRVDEQIAALVAVERAKGTADPSGHAPPAARTRMLEGIALVEAEAPAGIATRDLAYQGPGSVERARLYEPDGLGASSPGLLYIHGGGFTTCDIATHDVFCRRLALGARARVVSIEYRLAPEHPFPAALDDSLAAWRWFWSEAPTLGIDRARAGVGGDSAGGHLSALVAQHTRGTEQAPAVQLLVYPAVDATCCLPSHRALGEGWLLTARSLEHFYGSYFGLDRAVRAIPDASPLAAPKVDGVAPALVYTAGFDPLRDEGEAYAERLRASGVPARAHRFATMIHGFIQLTGICDAARKACIRIADDLGAALRDPSRVG
jgi:acetyl esterase